MELDQTAAIVTGGASGLGASAAAALASRGARVHVFDLPEAIETARSNGCLTGVSCIPVDVTDIDQVRSGVAAATSCGQPLRTVINCAGIAPSARILGSRGVHDLDLYARVISVNLIGSFNVLATASEQMALTQSDANGQRGIVLNTASVAAYEGQIGQAAYSSSKAGIVGLTLPAARDLARYGIRVMTIAPGILITPMLMTVSEKIRAGLAAGVPFPSRLGQPCEYAQLAMSIIENDYLNGEVIRLDGALRMAPC